MPKFNLAPKPTDLEPQWPPAEQSSERKLNFKPPAPRLSRGERAAEVERQAGNVPVIGGFLRPAYQFMNAMGSPDVLAGVVTGPINGISMLGNAIGDLVQGKPFRDGRGLSNADWGAIDAKDAWTISDKQNRAMNPIRLLWEGNEVTPADEAGLEIGEGIGAEIAGAATGATLLRAAANLRRVQQAAQALRQTQAVRSAAVAIAASPRLATATNVVKNVGNALVSTTLAAPFLNQEDGNLAHLGDLAGLRLPGRVEESDNYLQALGKSIAVEGIAAPLALMGMGSFIAPIRRGLATGDLGVIREIADAELAPYVPHLQQQVPALPAAGQSGLPQLPGYTPQGGAIVPYDSAITRSLQEQTQIRQVVEQRQRLEGMGLAQQGEGGQMEFALGGAVDPEIRLQVRQLQTQRGLLIKQGMESGQDVTADLGKIDQEIGDLIQAGKATDFMPGERTFQPELDLPDGRPELDTYLAQLDELSDAELRQIHSRVYQQDAQQRQLQEQAAVQQRVAAIQEQIADIERRRQLGTERYDASFADAMDLSNDEVYAKYPGLKEWEAREQELTQELMRTGYALVQNKGIDARSPKTRLMLNKEGEKLREQTLVKEFGEYPGPKPPKKGEALTDTGARRLLTKAQNELAAAQAQLQGIEARARVPESLVGDQLQLRLEQQMTLELTPQVQLPPLREITRTASEYGYRTPDDYRTALQGWHRDQLRQLAMPNSNPEVAALVKARTGRRVWQAKKSDIIDALVELGERQGRYLPPEAEQLAMELRANQFGDAAPLFDRPADLNVPGMQKTLDADGNEVVVPMDDYSGRGMDANAREQLKAQILQRAIDNGEVQAPITPLPERPATQFQQGSLVDQLMADETGQLPLMYATDGLPTYKAGGKGGDALIEEMRLRLEYQALDEAAQQAQRKAYLAEKGWDTMTWEEKKKLGILDEGFYSLKPYSERFRPETPAARSDLDAPAVERPPEPYTLTFKDGEAVIVEASPQSATGIRQGLGSMGGGLADALRRQMFDAFKEGKTKVSGVDEPLLAAAKKKLDPQKTDRAAFDKFINGYEQAKAKAQAKATKVAATQQTTQLSKRAQELLKKREDLLRQSQGAKC